MGITATRTPRAAARTPYEEHRNYVLGVLYRRCGWLDRDEREEAFHDAYAVLLEKVRDGALDLDAMGPQQVRAFLTQTAIHKGLDEGKKARRKRSVPLGDTELTEPDGGRLPDELVAAGLDGARVREIVDELSERRQAIVKLRYYFERTPEEIQQCLGITERVYRRELERAVRHLAERYELVRAGTFCESRRSVVLAYVLGIAGPGRAEAARTHLATCPACAAWAGEVRGLAQQAAGVLPLPAVLWAAAPGRRLADAASSLRDQLLDTVATIKQHAFGVAARVDQATLGSAPAVRPGAVAMAIAGCVAVGSATYCSVEGIPGSVRALGDAIGLAAPPRRAAEHSRRAVARKAPPPAPTTVAAPTPARTTARPAPAPQPARRRPARRARSSPSPAAAAQEFGIEAGVPASAAPAPAPAPAPTPAAPAGEFDP